MTVKLSDFLLSLAGGTFMGPTGPSGPAGPTVYPAEGIAVSTGTSWDTSLMLASDGGVIVDTRTGAVQASNGGDVRGSGSVDLQLTRITSSQVSSGSLSAVLGGRYNTASGDLSVTAGGQGNTASDNYSVVVGGQTNTASDEYSVVVGGQGNAATRVSSLVLGGDNNTASMPYSTVLNGTENTIQDAGTRSIFYRGILGGSFNTIDASANGFNTILGGTDHLISGGIHNAILYGEDNEVAGSYAMAGGRRSKAIHAGSVVLSDSTNADHSSTQEDELRLRFSNGAYLNGDPWVRTSGDNTWTGINSYDNSARVIIGASSSQVVKNPAVAYINGNGRCEITLPNSSSTMVSMRIAIRQFTNAPVEELQLNGYWLGSNWGTSNTGMYMVSNSIERTVTKVEFANVLGAPRIILSNDENNWSFATVSIEEVSIGWNVRSEWADATNYSIDLNNTTPDYLANSTFENDDMNRMATTGSINTIVSDYVDENALPQIANVVSSAASLSLNTAAYPSGSVFFMTGNSAVTYTLSGGPAGTRYTVILNGTGSVTFQSDGFQLQSLVSSAGQTPVLSTRYHSVTCVKRTSTIWVVEGAIDASTSPQTRVLADDFDRVNSTATVLVPGMEVALESGATYLVEGRFFVSQGPDVNSGWRMNFARTSGLTFNASRRNTGNLSGAATGGVWTNLDAQTSLTTTVNNRIITWVGSCQVNSGGVLQLQFGQGANSANYSRLEAGSSFTVTRAN